MNRFSDKSVCRQTLIVRHRLAVIPIPRSVGKVPRDIRWRRGLDRRGSARDPRGDAGRCQRPGCHPRGHGRAGARRLGPQRPGPGPAHQRDLHGHAGPDRGLPGLRGAEYGDHRCASSLRDGDRRPRRNAPSCPASRSPGVRPAPGGVPPRLPARGGGSAYGPSAVSTVGRRAPGVPSGAARIRSLHVVGTGLIGTSVALAASAAGVVVTLADEAEDRLRRAVERGAGRASAPEAGCDLVLVAVPPAAVAEGVSRYSRQMLGVTVTHVSSVQARPLLDIEAKIGKVTHVVGGHPIAGREQSGPDAAAGELFRDRAWVVCPAAYTAVDAVEAVEALALLCGARPVRMDPVEHDELLARLSHAPQLVASALAAAVAELPPGAVSLAGSGLRDTTRLADSDVRLWTEIISANPAAVAHALRAVLGPLSDLADVLDAGNPEAAAGQAAALLRRGQVGRAMLPGKHGQRPTIWATVSVVVPDRPGALAELLAAVAGHDVNLEDLRVEHAPGQPEGAAELAVAPHAQGKLAEALRADGWSVTLGTNADR